MTFPPAEGCISIAEERLRSMLAACGPFQTWVGAGIDPYSRIHILQLPEVVDEEIDAVYGVAEIKARRPFAVIWTPADQPFQVDILASPAFASQSGVLGMRLEENVPDQYLNNYAYAYRLFLNTVGLIIQSNEASNPGLVELLLRQEHDYLSFRNINVKEHMRTSSDDVPTMGDAHKCELEISWGASL